MIIGIQDELLRINSLGLLDRLLADRTTKAHILWATDAYTDLGPGYQRDREIRAELITGERSGVIKNRARKALEQQSARTRQHAEVFTPNWVCAKMCDYADEVWFGRPDTFFKDDEPTNRVGFSKRKNWKRYVDDRRMEITCGEAPFLASRYDVSNGEIIPLERRTGLLDRKLRVVSENTDTEEEWLQWSLRAFQATYGYEFQGDNLLIARLNLLMTFEEYLSSRWKRKPTKQEYETIANVIVWNLWQMDGLTYTIPYRKPEEEGFQFDFFEKMGFPDKEEKTQPYCRIYDWRKKTSVEFQELRRGTGKMKFNFIIGNPPYQEETEGTSDKPVYNSFMDAAYLISDKVLLITPARFLFNAGKTPKAWNEKMLNDEHFTVLDYAQDSGHYFQGTRITGGISISYRDATKSFGAIEVFSQYEEIRSLSAKMHKYVQESSLPDIMILQNRLNLDSLYQDYPQLRSVISSEGNERRIVSSAFNKLPIFQNTNEDRQEMIAIFGLEGTGQKRVKKWVDKNYIEDNGNLFKHKIMVSKSNGGAGNLCETPVRIIAEPFILGPGIGYTQSFIGIGAFAAELEATSALKYIKSKFARCLLGILKITQDNPPERWRFIPLQDFTPASDIDWSRSIPEIDRQLYAKYGLDEAEIAFIESHVKEMS